MCWQDLALICDLINYVCNGFAFLYIFYHSIEQSKIITQVAAEYLLTQPAITCSKLTIEALKQGVKHVQS